MKFKPNYKTTEFFTTCLELLGLGASLWLMPDPDIWAEIFTSVVAGYIFARGMFKRSRGDCMYNGQKTSEFIFYWLGMVVLALNYWKLGASLNVTMICMTVISLVFKISRGNAKTYIPPQTKIMNF